MLSLKTSDFTRNRKYLLAYILFIIFLSFCFFNLNNYLNFNFEGLILIILAVSGALILTLANKYDFSKTCFTTLLIFGLVMALTTPVLVVCDENEHFARSDLTSEGVLIPEYINDEGYEVTSLTDQLNSHRGETLTDNDLNEKIDSDSGIFNGCFPQNPFYAYIFSGLGLLLAKILDLTVIQSLYLGRILNVLFYTLICSFAIKKAPKYKLPLFVVSCLPLGLYQAASFSSDGFVISMIILALAYFIKIYTSNKVKNNDILVFFGAIFLASLLKFPYILFTFLIFLVRQDKFENKKMFILSRSMPIVLLIICGVYSSYASGLLQNTLRKEHFITNNVNPTEQLNYLINHPYHSFLLASTVLSFISEMIIDLFRFSYEQWTYESSLLSILYLIFFSIFLITYDNKLSLKRKEKVIVSIIGILIFIGTILIQLLSWAPVGYERLDMMIGVYARYYIPLLTILPLLSPSETVNINDYDLKTILVTLMFLSGSIIFTLSVFY